MAAGDVLQGLFSRTAAQGRATIAALIGGTTYHYLRIRADGPFLIGNSTIDPTSAVETVNAHRLIANEEVVIENNTATAGMIDGGKINVQAANGQFPVSIDIFAIANV